MLLNTRGRLPGWRGTVALVVLEEDVLQARLVARQRHDGIVGRGLDHSVGVTLHGDAHGVPAAQLLDLDDAVDPVERTGRYRLGEVDRDLVALDVIELVHQADAHEPALANDRHPRARLLNLAENMR